MHGRKFTGLLLAASLVAAAAVRPGPSPAATPAVSPASITLLGTGGGPGGRAERAGIATLLQVGGKNFLIDAGEGVSRQLARAGVSERQIDRVLITHLHDDHTAGLLGLATFAFTLRAKSMEIFGPAGTQDLVRGLVSVLNVSAQIRMSEGRFATDPAGFLRAQEFASGAVYAADGVKITAVENTHFRLPAGSPAARNKSYSLRFDFRGKSVVFTGDTGPSRSLVEFTQGADVLIAEMVSPADRKAVPPAVREHMDLEHLSPTEVGLLAEEAGVKTLILSHVGEVDHADLAEVRRNFRGPVILGKDLMRLPL